MKRRLLNILISIDQLILTLVTLGWAYPDETISSIAWRYQEHHWAVYRLRLLIDWLFSPFEDDHCFKSYLAEVRRSQSFKYGADMAETRRCQNCGKEFKAVLIHPSVVYCSGKCEIEAHENSTK